MDNHGCKGCLTPSLCITYPPNSNLFKRYFPVLLAFLTCLDKIKIGGDSFLPYIFNYKSQFTVLQHVWMRNNLRNLFFALGFHNHRSDIWIRHDGALSTSAHPSEVRP